MTVEMDEPKTEEENTAENTTWGQFASIYTPRGILQKLIVHVRERSVSSPSSCLLSSLVCLLASSLDMSGTAETPQTTPYSCHSSHLLPCQRPLNVRPQNLNPKPQTTKP